MTVKILSLSLGSATGNYQYVGKVCGRNMQIGRIGFGGNIDKLKHAFNYWDGKVAVIALGGLNFNYTLGTQKYSLPQADEIKKLVKRTPLVDGENWKRYWDPIAVNNVIEQGIVQPSDKILCSSALDRWNLCTCFESNGFKVSLGDALFALKLPIVFPSTQIFKIFGRATMPLLAKLPIEWLYPVSDKQQERGKNRWTFVVDRYNVFVGDSHYLQSYGPSSYKQKTIIGSTFTKTFVNQLKQEHAKHVVSLNPTLGDRAFGANVWEAIAVAVAGSVKDFLSLYHLNPQIFW